MVKKEKFNDKWSTSPTKKRGVKFMLAPTDEQHQTMLEYQVRHKEAVAHMAAVILKKLQDGSVTQEQIEPQRNSKFADSLWKTEDKHLTKTLGLTKSRQKRGACFLALRFFRGYLKRNNKLPKELPRLRHTKATYLEDGIVKDKSKGKAEGIFRMSVHGRGEKKKAPHIDIDYTIPKGMMYKKSHVPDDFGGNLVRSGDKWWFTAVATIPFEWQYEPEQAIGFDLNKTPKFFITLSEKIKFDGEERDTLPHSKAITSHAKKLTKLNEEIKDETLTSKQRRAVRKKWHKAHLKMERLCKPYCDQIISQAKEKKALLCIDDLSCGARTGSFGQDKVVSMLTKMCEDQGVPYIAVPTPYTSKVCNKCKAKGERPNPDVVECPNCGTVAAHHNAAKNIAEWGMKIWKEGEAPFRKWRDKLYKTNKKTPVQPAEPKEDTGKEQPVVTG